MLLKTILIIDPIGQIALDDMYVGVTLNWTSSQDRISLCALNHVYKFGEHQNIHLPIFGHIDNGL